MAAELADWLGSRGVRPLLSKDVAQALGKAEVGAEDHELAQADLLVVLGGDGSMLRWTRLIASSETPMMGVNFGRYGFITEIEPEMARTALEGYLAGNYAVSDRVVLKARVDRASGSSATYYGLNDVVLAKGPISRMVALDTYVNDKFIVTYAADGIIVASPTGSTAYSLSAGGPVVHPDVSVLIITPVCPHTLNVRSLVVPDAQRIKIVGQCRDGEGDTVLTIDGQLGEHLGCGDEVEICKADFTAKLVQMEPQSFYDKLQTRLRWGERYSA